MDFNEIKRSARTTIDEHGEAVVQIPLPVWERFLAQDAQLISQKAQIEALLAEWNNESDESDQWWNNFELFINQNRLTFKDE
jgi:hypothetical protein